MRLVVIKNKREILDALERARAADSTSPEREWLLLREYIDDLPGDWVAVVNDMTHGDNDQAIRYLSLDDWATTSGLGTAQAH